MLSGSEQLVPGVRGSFVIAEGKQLAIALDPVLGAAIRVCVGMRAYCMSACRAGAHVHDQGACNIAHSSSQQCLVACTAHHCLPGQVSSSAGAPSTAVACQYGT